MIARHLARALGPARSAHAGLCSWLERNKGELGELAGHALALLLAGFLLATGAIAACHLWTLRPLEVEAHYTED